MDLNIKFNQDTLFKKIFNSKILIYGPGNSNIDKDVENNLFNDYDYLIINSGMINILKKKIDLSKIKVIHVLGGLYVDDFKDVIIEDDKLIYMYFVSEIHTMNVLINYGINPMKIMHMANNYKKYGISGWPHMGPKLFIFFEQYNLKFKKMFITGYTFYMDKDIDGSIYNLEYQDYNNLLENHGHKFEHIKNKSVNELTIEDKILLNKTNEDLSLDTPKNSNTGHSIFEGYNVFLRFLSKNTDTVKIDKKLKKIIKKYPKLLSDNPF